MSLGRWLGVNVRLHISFVLLAIFVLYLFMRPPLENMAAHGWALLGVWFASVLLHEAGRLIAAARLGCMPDVITLTPLGARSTLTMSLEPQREVAHAMAGPLANLAAWMASGCLLFALGDVALVQLLHPLAPENMLPADNVALSALQMTFWINWCLVLVNLLPAYPLDGGRVLQALLWHSLGGNRTLHLLTRATQSTAVGLLLLGWLLGMPEPGHPLPAAFPLAILATYLLFQAKHPLERSGDDERQDDLFGYDFSEGYTSLEPPGLEQRVEPASPRPGPIGRWLERRRDLREQQRLETELAEEQRADVILAALHERGPNSLSAEDRALLDRVSARYRARLAKG